MKVIDYLDEATINLHLEGESKEGVLAALVGMLVRQGSIAEGDSLIEALLAREALGSTGIGHEVAIPHARWPGIGRLALALGRTDKGLDFDAIDGQPTRLFFLLVTPEQDHDEHLHLLARLARLMKAPKTREALLGVDSVQGVLELFRAQDTP